MPRDERRGQERADLAKSRRGLHQRPMSQPPRRTGGRPPGRPPLDPPSGPRPPVRRREPAGGEPLSTNPREANRRANQTARPMAKRPEAGSSSNPFGGRPVKVPRERDGALKVPRANNAPRRDRGTARAEAAASPGKIEPQRIAKLLARAGVGSRRDIERFIADGRVAINGTVLTTPAHVIASLDGVTFEGRPVAAIEATRLFRFHKPAGFLTTARDPGGRPTIFDALPPGLPRLVPVGRLDMNTEGLLLLTTDGALKRQLELPSNAVARRYRVRAYGEVTQTILEGLIEGIEIDGMRYGPINADIERRTGRNLWLAITLTEGKNREIRRVLEFLGLQVSRLIRVAYGPFELGDLPARAVEEINPQAIEQLRKSVGKAR